MSEIQSLILTRLKVLTCESHHLTQQALFLTHISEAAWSQLLAEPRREDVVIISGSCHKCCHNQCKLPMRLIFLNKNEKESDILGDELDLSTQMLVPIICGRICPRDKG